MMLVGKLVVVIGFNIGIGKVIVWELVRVGVRVILVCCMEEKVRVVMVDI